MAVSYNHGISYNRVCMANWVDDSHRLASTNRMWNWNRTTFWTFYCRQSTGMVLACRAHRTISRRHKRLEFHVGRLPRGSISSVRIVRQSCACWTRTRESNINKSKSWLNFIQNKKKPEFSLTKRYAMPFHVPPNINFALGCNPSIRAIHKMWP